jgi:hypothetical protein
MTKPNEDAVWLQLRGYEFIRVRYNNGYVYGAVGAPRPKHPKAMYPCRYAIVWDNGEMRDGSMEMDAPHNVCTALDVPEVVLAGFVYWIKENENE